MPATSETKTMRVQGMTCDNCVRHVTKALQSVKGVSTVSVDLKSGMATVQLDPSVATPAAMAAAVQKAGYALTA